MPGLIAEGWAIYRATRKRHDQLFNAFFMRPIAGACVAALARTPVTPNQLTLAAVALFAVAATLLVALPDARGALVAVGVLELSYLLDCADGMLARHRKTASVEGHLFDYFTDEIKAVMLATALGLRLWRSGGFGWDGRVWAPGDARFLVAGMAAVAIIASATSLTSFVRRPELTGRATPVEAHYEAVARERAGSLPARALDLLTTFLRFLNHYPSHIWLFALAGRLDALFWIYLAINALYLGRGWLGLVVRFGRPPGP
jgi:phosphatidylglycerophosphate synthase